jgi:heterogeneous nuclear rnp K-like protein 2
MSVDTVPAPAPADTGANSNNGPSPATADGGAAAAAGSSSPSGNNSGARDTSFNSQSAAGQFTLRALVSSKEAGIIIGKAGKNVADLREATGVKAGVSKVVQGVPERVLSVTGSLEGVTKVRLSPLSFQAFNSFTDMLHTSAGLLYHPPEHLREPFHRS